MGYRTGIKPLAAIGIIIIAFSVAAFFLLDFEKNTVNIWALAFLLLSELVFFGMLIGIRLAGAGHSNVFLRVGVSSALSLYLAATLISVLFSGAFKDNVRVFILIELAIIVAFVVIAISIFTWSRVIARRNEADLAKVGSSEPKRGGF